MSTKSTIGSIRKTLEQKLFPFVIKPGRYSGGEMNQTLKDPAGRLSYLHTYPDKYEIGQSYPGLQSLYHIVNADDRFVCERAFAVDTDAEKVMRRENIPLFSLESSRPAKDFDAIGFTLTFELVYTNMMAMIDLAGIPLSWRDRSDDDPIIMAGGPSVYSPEPIAEFCDLIFIGDAEEGLPEILGLLHEMKTATRLEKLEAIVRKVDSVYVPRFYDDDRKPTVDFAPEKIRARLIGELKNSYYPDKPLVPLIDTIHSTLSVEIMRGCPQGCRFCQAGPMYRPVRARSKEDVLKQIDTQWKNTGYEEVTLLSLSSSDYPEIEELATTAARRLEPARCSISLPALRPGTIGPKLLSAASRIRKSGLTIAPEAGTDRLRLFIRKDFPDAAIYDSVRIAYSKGWTTVKLYFMIGLPTETEEDLDGILNIIRRISEIGREYNGRKTINVTLSPFVPRPHTPLQWDGMLAVPDVIRTVGILKRRNRVRNVNFKHQTAEMSLLEGVLARGGRELSKVLLTAFQSGCRFDGWSEGFDWEKWQAAFAEHELKMEDFVKPMPFSADLPWSHILKGVSTEHLQEERQRTSMQLRDFAPRFGEDEPAHPTEPVMEFGRANKKVVSRQSVAPTKNRLRIRWGKTERCRYMSHLDNLRAIERSLRRAGLPVAFTQGFNPSMKLSFGPPLPLGLTSEAEYADIILDSNIQSYMVEKLTEALPQGFQIFEAKAVIGKAVSLSAALNRVIYTTPVKLFGELDKVEERLMELMAMDKIEVDRTTKRGTHPIDIRPAMYNLTVNDEVIEMTLGVGEGGYARPTELVKLLDDNLDERCCSFLLHRKAMYCEDGFSNYKDAMDL